MPAGKGPGNTGLRDCTPPRVVIDACIWHGAFVRHVLRHLALAGLFEPRWTVRIESEWLRSVRRARPEIPAERLMDARDRFREEFPLGLLPVRLPTYQLPPLPDPDDAHVIEAAMTCSAQAVCTLDAHGFPTPIMRRLGIEVLSPDELVTRLLATDPRTSRIALTTHRAALRAPRMSRDQYLNAMRSAGLPRSADLVRPPNPTA